MMLDPIKEFTPCKHRHTGTCYAIYTEYKCWIRFTVVSSGQRITLSNFEGFFSWRCQIENIVCTKPFVALN